MSPFVFWSVLVLCVLACAVGIRQFVILLRHARELDREVDRVYKDGW